VTLSAARRVLALWLRDFRFFAVREKEELAKLPDAERTAWVKLWADTEALRSIRGPLEGEGLRVFGKSSDFPLGAQNVTPDWKGQWSGHAHLWGRPSKVGEWADLELPVPADGKYQVFVCLTKAPDYGIVQFFLDGRPIGRPFDGFEPKDVVGSVPVKLGVATLKKGTAVLRVAVTGTNDKSLPRSPTGSRYMWGLDCVVLQPMP
jgi:hypothetical protein